MGQAMNAKKHWRTTKGGGMVAQGCGVQFVGRPGDLIIADDPYRGFYEASSHTVREQAMRAELKRDGNIVCIEIWDSAHLRDVYYFDIRDVVKVHYLGRDELRRCEVMLLSNGFLQFDASNARKVAGEIAKHMANITHKVDRVED